MMGPGIARELARQRELAIAHEAERPRVPRESHLGAFLPSVSVLAGVLLLLTLGAPMP